jgi:hypothetical protein
MILTSLIHKETRGELSDRHGIRRMIYRFIWNTIVFTKSSGKIEGKKIIEND